MAIHNEPKTAAPLKESKGRNRHSKKTGPHFQQIQLQPQSSRPGWRPKHGNHQEERNSYFSSCFPSRTNVIICKVNKPF